MSGTAQDPSRMKRPKAVLGDRARKLVHAVENTKGARPKGKNVGKLAGIYVQLVRNVPVEIFVEILSHLPPIDILHLARVSNDLRQMLMTRNIKWLWDASLARLDPPPPPCPDHFAAPDVETARMIFKKSFKGIPEAKAETEICSLLPEADEDMPSGGSEVSKVDQCLSTNFYVPEFEVVFKRLLELRRSGDAAALAGYTEQRRHETLTRLNFHVKVGKWDSAWEDATYKAERNARETAVMNRENAIKERLFSLGYQEEDLPPRKDHEFWEIVCQRYPLSERIWNKIQGTLIDQVELNRARHASQAFLKEWEPRIDTFRAFYEPFLAHGRTQPGMLWKRTLPTIADAVKIPAVRALITRTEAPSVNDYARELTEKMDELAEPYRVSVRRDLACITRSLAEHKEKLAKKRKLRAPAAAKDQSPAADAQVPSKPKANKRTKKALPAPSFDDKSNITLLEDIGVRFGCRECSWHVKDATTQMPYPDTLLHFQMNPTKHPQGVWFPGINHSALNTTIFAEPQDQGSPMRLLFALGLPPGTTASELAEMTGRATSSPTCTCGEFGGDSFRQLMYGNNDPDYYSPLWVYEEVFLHVNGFRADKKDLEKHLITIPMAEDVEPVSDA
ncbi:uncharacterized protein BXZ73DRAFT_105243 [Epithele typhae]|uniref:uncharacterized protein n=1 Tax=Epithele typhae TaxID=378194 RepID=UPI002007E329|nr:uncharacterized protein BXZ73DRAFT_105243 [Epithele typhae]KAH9918362.1 hypothetical protein BXZ73DRAFT_105243 [Epithele typhae]